VPLADVFLSYARPDAAAAERIARELGKAGFSVWYDREIPAHRTFADVIATELESAHSVLVLWSESACASEWVRSEANRARELRKLVQARLDDVRLPMPFDQIQCADLRSRARRKGHGWAQVRTSIDALIGGTGEMVRRPALYGNRRGMLIGAGAAAAATMIAGGALWLREDKADHPNPEAALLLQKGMDTLQSNDVFAADNPGSLKDAIALLTEATEADPRSSVAWGSLALAFAALKRVSPPSERPGLDGRSRSAAKRAFEIDPHEPRATGALLVIEPLYRHWLDAEQRDRRALKAAQPLPLLLFVLAEMLASVGRCREAAEASARFDRKSFIIPGADERALVYLWSGGDLQAADQALAMAVQHWPQHPQVWRSRVAYLMYSGRASEALQLLHDPTQLPPGTPEDRIEAMQATAKALTGQLGARDAIEGNLAYLKANPTGVFPVVHACAVLGDSATAFATLEGYYFGEGRWADLAPLGGDEARQTEALFQPPMHSMLNDPRFGQLVQRIGLEDYWRQTGTRPDYRGR